MRTVSTHIAKFPLLIMLLIAFLSSSVAVHYAEDTAVVAIQVKKQHNDEQVPANDFVIKQASFEAVIPFVHSFIPQNFFNFSIPKPVVVLVEVCTSPQVTLSIPVYLRNIFSNIIASNAP